MKAPENTRELREVLATVMVGLNNGTIDKATAHEISNAAGKFIASVRTDIMGEALKRHITSYTHDALTLNPPVIEVEKV